SSSMLQRGRKRGDCIQQRGISWVTKPILS
ncbi:subtilase family protein, partial [Vibrio parahaemolyticus IDH02640]